nr:reverse transcriptase domain-containing protein [Tanacetum cinerariifolium]
MNAVANTTPIVTTVTKAANKEKMPKEADAALKVNILDFCEENYEDILPVIMDKIRRDKRIEVHARLDFEETSKKSQRVREGSQNSSVGTLPARYRNLSERPKRQDRLRHNDENVFDRLGHQRHSVFDQLSDTYSPSTTKSGPDRANSRDRSHSRGRSRKRDSSPSRDRPRSRDRLRGIEESYGITCSSYRIGTRLRYHSHDRDRSRSMKRGRESESPLSRRDGETIEDFIERFKVETGHMKGAPECMRIFGFMHGVNNPDLTKCLNEHAPKTMEEMLTTTTAFIRGETAATSKKKGHTSWKPQDQPNWHVSERRSDFRGQPREGQGSNMFTPLPGHLNKSSRPKRESSNRHHPWDECVQLKKQIKELVRAGKLSHLIKEIKPGRDQPKLGKKEVPTKDKSMAIYMVQLWHRMTRKKVTQSFSCVREITFPSLATSRGTEGPLVIKAEIGRHMIHRMLLVIIEDAEYSTKAWMNFMIVRSLSPYNGIIGRPGIREIQEVPSIAHEMLKFPIDGGIITIRSTILIFAECAAVTTASKEILKEAEVRHKNFNVALHLNFLDQEVAIEETLSVTRRTGLCSILKENLDIFAWQPSDMTGVLRSVAEHRLNIREGYTPKSTGKLNLSATTPLSVSWTFTKAITKYRWQNRVKRKRLSTPAMEYIAIPKCPSVSRTLAPHTSGWWTKLLTTELLNPKKCTFEAVEGMFLGYMISPERIKPCPDKTEAVLRLSSPRTIKEVQSLNRKLASLNRFLSKSAKKSLPLFKTLKKCIKKSDFHWILEAEQAFKQIKQHLSELPMLVAPKPKEELIVYLSASHGAISAVLMTERRLQEWSVILGEYNITYRPRTPVKGQILADFLVEKSDEAPPDMSMVNTPQELWILFTDRSSCIDGSGSGLILTSPKGTEFTYVLRFQFIASNNEAEYETLIDGLRITAQMGVYNVYVSVDSKLVANQVIGTYVTKEENMIKYLEKAKSLVSGFTNFSISQVPRSKNKKVDALSKIASTIFSHLSKQVLVEILKENTIQEKEVATVVEKDGPTWMTPIMEYLKDGTFPGNIKEARKLRIKAKQYELLEGVLYRRSFLKPWLRKGQVFDSHYRLFYEVDRGKSYGDNHRQLGEEVRVGQHSVPLRPSERNSLGQRNKGPPGRGKQELDRRTPHVLWAHRTMIKSSHGDTPFSLTYGTEAVIPVEIGMPTYHTVVVDAVHNNEELQLNLDLPEEMRKRAAIREAKTKLKMTNYYNARVRGVTFKPGDFVYRSNDASHAVDRGKLGPKWEGPYEVTEALGDGA